MKHIKLFEEMNIEENEFPEQGHGRDLSPREIKILTDFVPEFYLRDFRIKVEDHYYYCHFTKHHNRFDNFNELKDYILYTYYIDYNKTKEYMDLLKISELDPSIDDNWYIKWFIYKHRNHGEENRDYIKIVRILLNDKRVRDKLPEWQINKYTNEIS